jgi:hypothetical protein
MTKLIIIKYDLCQFLKKNITFTKVENFVFNKKSFHEKKLIRIFFIDN